MRKPRVWHNPYAQLVLSVLVEALAVWKVLQGRAPISSILLWTGAGGVVGLVTSLLWLRETGRNQEWYARGLLVVRFIGWRDAMRTRGMRVFIIVAFVVFAVGSALADSLGDRPQLWAFLAGTLLLGQLCCYQGSIRIWRLAWKLYREGEPEAATAT